MNYRTSAVFIAAASWLFLSGWGSHPPAPEQDYAAMREQMVKEIEADVRYTSRYIGRKVLDTRVMEAVGRVPRHEFVPQEERPHAYENRPLPIGWGQTISQPYIVALMSDLMRPNASARVLEIGTGSGYQAAILGELVDQVYTIEIVDALADEARERLHRLGYDNVTVRLGDGYYGWEEHAPFDAIIVTAASPRIPPPLIEQLKPGGVMVIPVGHRFLTQQLTLVEKGDNGEISTRLVLPVAFVPLTGDH
jgi:protein-L-isoaspartate(D-aspartate) O-methyltransferase